jgi:RNA polymerase sigma factor (sigma-70 family)
MSVVHIEEIAALLEQHRPSLLAYLGRSFHLEAAEQEDVAQEACLRAYRAIARGQAIQSQAFVPWLYRITRNLAIDCWRHRSRLLLTPLNETQGYRYGAIDEYVIERIEVGAVLAQLPPVLAQSLLLFYVYGYSAEEIARRQHVQGTLVRVRMLRARRQFAALYRKRAQEIEAVGW